MIEYIKKMHKFDNRILGFIALELVLMILSLTSAFLSPLVYERYIDECLVEKNRFVGIGDTSFYRFLGG